MEKIKICKKCGSELLATREYFYNVKRNADGFQSICIECDKKNRAEYRLKNADAIKERRAKNSKINSKRTREWVLNNPEKAKERQSKYALANKERLELHRKSYYLKNSDHSKEKSKEYVLANKEKISIYRKEYRIKNKEKICEYLRIHYENNKEAIAKNNKQYRKEHIEAHRINNQRRKSLKKQLPSTLTEQQWANIKLHFNNSCAYCGKESILTQEHFIALSKGGEYSFNNIIPSCQSCNSSKGNKDFFIWYSKYKYYSSIRQVKILKYLNYDKNKIQQLALIV